MYIYNVYDYSIEKQCLDFFKITKCKTLTIFIKNHTLTGVNVVKG